MLKLGLGLGAAKAARPKFDITSDLQVHWRFQEADGSTTLDETAYNNDATLYNMDASNRLAHGENSIALSCNGTNEYVQSGSFNSNAAQATWAYWLYLPDVSQTSYARTFTTSNQIDQPSAGISHEINPGGAGNNKLAFVHWANSPTLIGTVTVPLNAWFYVTHVAEGNGATIYINGVQMASGAGSRSISNRPITIGAGDGKYGKMRVDDVRVYARALSADDVAALYAIEAAAINNESVTSIPYFEAALANVIADTGSARVLCVGDSLTFGTYSTGSNNDPNQKQFSYPAHLKDLFLANGIQATEENFIGWGGGHEYNIAHDERLSYTGTPSRSVDWTIGGGAIQLVSGESITFSPNEAVDTFKIYAIGYNGAASIAISIDGSLVQTSSLSTGSDQLVTPIVIDAGTLDSHYITLAHSGTGNAFIYGVEAYDSSKNQITIFNTGSPASKATDWDATGKPWSPINSWDYYDPDLILICLGANEWISGDSTATYQAALEDIIDGILAYGDIDVALVIPPPSNETTYSNQAAYRTVLQNLAVSYDIPLIDIYTAFGGQAAADALGYYVGDDVHLTSTGYQAMAAEVYDVIKP